MLSRLASCFALLLALSAASEIKEDEGVLVLTKDNFQGALAKYDHLFVEFYAPWCGHCKALAPEYVKTAAKLKAANSEIRLGKIDATEETELAETYGIKGYPTLKFFKGGRPIEYPGARQADDMINWLSKKTGPAAKTLAAVEEVKSFIEDNEVCVVGFFQDASTDAAKNFMAVAQLVDDYPFGLVSDSEVFNGFDVKGEKVVLFKKFDDKEVTYEGEPNEEDLKKFITLESLPLVVEFSHETGPKLFSGEFKSHLILFGSKKSGHFEEIFELLKPVAKEFRNNVLFVTINIDEPDHKRILEFFGVNESEIPAMRVIKLDDNMTKYKPESADLTADNVKSFIQAYLDGKLKENLLSQPLPDDWDKKPVKVLVSSNFDEVVFDKEKNVLVEFYAPWCGHCQQLEPIYDKLGEKFQDNPDFVIAKLNAVENELEHTKIGSFPTLHLYAKGDNKLIRYDGERTLEGLTKFLESGGEYGRGVEEGDEEESDDLPKKDEL